MKLIETIPQTKEEQDKKRRSLTLGRKATGGICVACAVAALILLFGAVIVLVLSEIGDRSVETKTLFYILAGSFLGGAILLAVVAFLLGKFLQTLFKREFDFCERCDGEKSFYVGEDTLATFGDGAVFFHSEKTENSARVPYAEMRFFSVCSRKKPAEKGEWSVVMELPARYLTKDGTGDNTVLVQADAKERLYRCLEEEGITLLGELPKENAENKKFTCLKEFALYHRPRRKTAAIFMAFGGLCAVGGIPLALLWQTTIGSLVCVLGAFILGRAVFSFLRAKRSLVVYEEGLLWKDFVSNAMFLKWEEIESVELGEEEGEACITIRCAYGAYHFPSIGGAYEYIQSKVNPKA